jgi:hypothetical protein
MIKRILLKNVENIANFFLLVTVPLMSGTVSITDEISLIGGPDVNNFLNF